jgi:hypothetical protein
VPPTYNEEVDESRARESTFPLDKLPPRVCHVEEAMSHLARPLVPLMPPAELNSPPAYIEEVDKSRPRAFTLLPDTPFPRALHVKEAVSYLARWLVPLTPPTVKK